MCFGNKLNQNRPEHCITPFPTPNNFCGGFALNAVLVDLGSGTCPIEVYMRIQDYQNKEIIEKNPESAASKYLLGNKSSGTLMSLPSGICAAFNPNRSLEKASCHFLMTAIRKTALYMLDS